METIIYGLVDANTLELRYVGKTANLEKRMRSHLYKNDHTHKARWIKTLNRGVSPLVLERVEGNGAEAEKLWIRRFRDFGARMTNLTDGGEGVVGYVCTQATREKMSKSHRGVPLSPSHRENGRLSRIGRPLSAVHRFAISLSNTGKKATSDQRAKMSKAKLGKAQSPEMIAKRVIALTGKKRTSNQRRMFSEIQPLGASGVRGVSWDIIRNKWLAKLKYKRKIFNLGRYDNIEDAAQACQNFRAEKGW